MRLKPTPPGGPRPEPDRMAAWLRRHREALGISVTELAERVGVTPSFVSQIESGRKRPTSGKAQAIAAYLGVDREVLESWVRAYRPTDLHDATTAIQTVNEFLAREESGEHVLSLSDMAARREQHLDEEGRTDLKRALREAETSAAHPRLSAALHSATQLVRRMVPAKPSHARGVDVPLLLEGADPGRTPSLEGNFETTIVVDGLLLQSARESDRLYAFRASGAAGEGPSVVIATWDFGQPFKSERLYVTCQHHRILVGRIEQRADKWLFLPMGLGAMDDSLEFQTQNALRTALRGRVIAIVRSFR